MVDIATLTGACVVALGGVRSGLFSTDDALAQALLAAGESALDPCWRMPLDDEYAEGLKTNFADVANVAGAPAAPSPRPSSCSASPASSLGAPGHRRHRLEERRGQGLDRRGRWACCWHYLLGQAGKVAAAAAKTARSAPKRVAKPDRRPMTEVAFHFNAPDKVAYACRLLRKAVGSGARVVVTAEADDAADAGRGAVDFCAPGIRAALPRPLPNAAVLARIARGAGGRGALPRRTSRCWSTSGERCRTASSASSG